MRVKKKKHGFERLESCKEVLLQEPEQLKGGAKAVFGNELPLYLEIGCGKGDFAIGMAERYPDRNFLAVERISDVLVNAAEKAQEKALPNLRLFCCDAKDLPQLFAPESLSGIYLNFSDPWPKKKHYKRRLTCRAFLEEYKRLLKDGGMICLKTDNADLFRFSLSEFTAAGLAVQNVTDDLHASPFAESNIMTEYERRFSAAGCKIHRAEALKQ